MTSTRWALAGALVLATAIAGADNGATNILVVPWHPIGDSARRPAQIVGVKPPAHQNVYCHEENFGTVLGAFSTQLSSERVDVYIGEEAGCEPYADQELRQFAKSNYSFIDSIVVFSFSHNGFDDGRYTLMRVKARLLDVDGPFRGDFEQSGGSASGSVNPCFVGQSFGVCTSLLARNLADKVAKELLSNDCKRRRQYTLEFNNFTIDEITMINRYLVVYDDCKNENLRLLNEDSNNYARYSFDTSMGLLELRQQLVSMVGRINEEEGIAIRLEMSENKNKFTVIKGAKL